jgi:uncharacterized protein (DUF1697 family)
MRYVALLRGINVGGHKKVSMADLRILIASLGHTDVSTYIQSGNALFTSPRDDPAELGREIERLIAQNLGLEVTVLIRTPTELEEVIASNPFLSAETSLSKLYVSFLSAQPEDGRLSTIDKGRFDPDDFKVGTRVIYLRYPNGAGRTKLTNDVLERALGLRATSRNWNTVTKLVELAKG